MRFRLGALKKLLSEAAGLNESIMENIYPVYDNRGNEYTATVNIASTKPGDFDIIKVVDSNGRELSHVEWVHLPIDWEPLNDIVAQDADAEVHELSLDSKSDRY